MAWVRTGDTSGMYPRLLAATALPDAPDGAYPMMFGFMSLLGTMSAASTTDYVVDLGTIKMCGGEHWRWLLAAAVTTGLLTKQRKKILGVEHYKLIDDPKFIHIRLKAEIDWENQQRNETRDPRLAPRVRLRDGDLCRYCGVIVHWAGPKSPRTGTLDHLVPKDAEGNRVDATVETLVVACLSCNSEIGDRPADDRPPLLPVPPTPFYRAGTAKFLTANGYPTLPTDGSEQRPASADTAPTIRQRPAKPDTASTTASDPAPAGHRAAREADQDQHAPPESPRLGLTPEVDKRDSTGTGRDGSGKAPLLASEHPTTARRKRSARGRNRTPGAQP